METPQTHNDDDLALVEEMALRYLDTQRMEVKTALEQILVGLQGNSEAGSLQENFTMLDELVASAPGSREEHIRVQESLKNLHAKVTDDSDDDDDSTDSDTE
jgi:hypothetical protein